MSITVALLHSHPDQISIARDSGFRLPDEVLVELDRLVQFGQAKNRAEAVKHILICALQHQAGTGRCELCGVVDQHLYQGACPHCRKHYHLPEPGQRAA